MKVEKEGGENKVDIGFKDVFMLPAYHFVFTFNLYVSPSPPGHCTSTLNMQL